MRISLEERETAVQ